MLAIAWVAVALIVLVGWLIVACKPPQHKAKSAARPVPSIAMAEPRIGGRTGPRATCGADGAVLSCSTGR